MSVAMRRSFASPAILMAVRPNQLNQQSAWKLDQKQEHEKMGNN